MSAAVQKQDPRTPTWEELLRARAAEEAKTWLKSEIMIAFHRRVLSPDTVKEVFALFGLERA